MGGPSAGNVFHTVLYDKVHDCVLFLQGLYVNNCYHSYRFGNLYFQNELMVEIHSNNL